MFITLTPVGNTSVLYVCLLLCKSLLLPPPPFFFLGRCCREIGDVSNNDSKLNLEVCVSGHGLALTGLVRGDV